jgi:hypothetical protein
MNNNLGNALTTIPVHAQPTDLRIPTIFVIIEKDGKMSQPTPAVMTSRPTQTGATTVRTSHASTQPDFVKVADASTQSGRKVRMADVGMQTLPNTPPFKFDSAPTHNSTRSKRRELKTRLEKRSDNRPDKATDLMTIKTSGLLRRGSALDDRANDIRQSKVETLRQANRQKREVEEFQNLSAPPRREQLRKQNYILSGVAVRKTMKLSNQM